jgi:hypothetical protein
VQKRAAAVTMSSDELQPRRTSRVRKTPSKFTQDYEVLETSPRVRLASATAAVACPPLCSAKYSSCQPTRAAESVVKACLGKAQAMACSSTHRRCTAVRDVQTGVPSWQRSLGINCQSRPATDACTCIMIRFGGFLLLLPTVPPSQLSCLWPASSDGLSG